MDAIHAFDQWALFAQLNLIPLLIGSVVAMVLLAFQQRSLASAILATSALPLVLGGPILALELATWSDPGPTCEWFCRPGFFWWFGSFFGLVGAIAVAALLGLVVGFSRLVSLLTRSEATSTGW